MRINTTFKIGALATIAFASDISPNRGSVLRSEDVLLRPYSTVFTYDVGSGLDARDRYQSNSTWSTGVEFTSDGSLNFTTWDNTTNAACISKLRTLPHSSSPSGNSICYNLPMLDTTTGEFEADLRLYHVSPPRDNFVGISTSDIEVGVEYKGASVSPMKSTTANSSTISSLEKRGDASDAPSGPVLLQSYMLVGQIDKDQLAKNLSALQAILIPILTLTAKAPSGATLRTNVSLNEASFLTGIFSDDVILSDTAAAQAAVNDQIAGLKNGTVAFVMPGTQLMIFPIGLIITSVWFVLGLGFVGYGTYERIRYRDLHRRALARAAR